MFPLIDIDGRGITITPGLNPSVILPIFTFLPLTVVSSFADCPDLMALVEQQRQNLLLLP